MVSGRISCVSAVTRLCIMRTAKLQKRVKNRKVKNIKSGDRVTEKTERQARGQDESHNRQRIKHDKRKLLLPRLNEP